MTDRGIRQTLIVQRKRLRESALHNDPGAMPAAAVTLGPTRRVVRVRRRHGPPASGPCPRPWEEAGAQREAMIATPVRRRRQPALTRAGRLRRSRRQASAQRLVCSLATVSPTYAWGVASPGAVATVPPFSA